MANDKNFKVKNGLDVSGIITATGGTSTNWNTAYGWGDHSIAGYASGSFLPLAGGTLTGELKVNAPLTIKNPTGTGRVEIGTIANDQQNGYVRGSIIMSRDEDQITYNTTSDLWVHAGGGSTDWSMISHISGGTNFYTGPALATETTYTNTAFDTAYKWLSVATSNHVATFKSRPKVGTNNIWHSGDFANNSANWDTSYTYSQVGHLPLAGGTLTGALTGTDITASGYLQATSFLYTRNNLRVLNAAGTGWNTWGTRVAGEYNLSVGTISATGALTGTTADFSSSVEANTFNVSGGAFVARNPGSANGSLWLAADVAGTAAVNTVTIAGATTAYAAFNANGIDIKSGGLSSNGTLVLDTSRNLTNIGTISSGIITATGGTSTNWNTAYTYSQVGHLPLAGGTLTGTLVQEYDGDIWSHGESTNRPVSKKLYSEVNIGITGTVYTDVYGEADLSAINDDETFTYNAAWAAVESHGGRLPTLAELEDEVGSTSGQGYDSEFIWTCTPAGPHHVWVCYGRHTSVTADPYKKIVDITDASEVYRTRAFFDVDRKTRQVTYDSSGDLAFGDSQKATFGADDDLQIYHDGTQSRIVDTGTGNLKIQANNFAVNNVADTENMITAEPDGFVKLFHNGDEKLATTSSGIDVTGSLTASGSGTFNNKINFTDDDITSVSTSLSTLNNGGLTIDLDGDNEVADTDFRVRLDRSSGASQLVLDASGNLEVEGTITATDYNDTNWNTAYTYSQVGHLPLSGGTLTGAVSGTSATFVEQISANGTVYPLTIAATDVGNTVDQVAGDGVGLQFKLADNTVAGGSFLGASIAATRVSASDANSETSLDFYVSNNDETLDKSLTLGSALNAQFRGHITQSSGSITAFGNVEAGLGHVKSSQGYLIGTATVIDSSRNLTNIGTISSGVITATGGNSTNWNTAYGWGDHSTAGYASGSFLPLSGGTLSGSLILEKSGDATVSSQTFNSKELYFQASGWDTDNSLARSFSWRIRNEPTASIYPDFDLTFQGGQTTIFQLHERGTAGNVDPKAATFFGNLHVEAGTGTNAGDGSLDVAGTITATDYNDTNWNTAYGWGDHSTAGYQTSAYSLPLATNTVRGGIELFSNTDQTVAANAVTSTAGRTYGVQLNSNNQAVVNVPWTSASGSFLPLSGGTLTGALVGTTASFIGGTTKLQITQSGAVNQLISSTGSFAATPLAFNIAGSEAMRITAAGNVGIGTSSPGKLLTVHYDAPAYDTVDDVLRLVSKFTSTNNAASALAGSGPSIVFAGGIGDNQTRDRARIVGVYEGSNQSGLSFHTQDTADIITEKMRLTSAANGSRLGIGTNDPSEKLHVFNGSIDTRGQNIEHSTTGLYFDPTNGNSAGTTNTIGSGVTWAPNYATYTKRSAGIMQVGEGNYFRSGLAFYTNNTSDSTTDWSERLRISKEGNVGIGTISPATKLDVSGVITATGGTSTTWNTAYGWGDHSTAGYLTSYTDTNTTYSAGTGITLTGTTFSLTDTNAKLNLSGGTLTGDLKVSKSDAAIYLNDSSGTPTQQGMRIRAESIDTNLPNNEGIGIVFEEDPANGSPDTTPAVITTGEFYAQSDKKVWHEGTLTTTNKSNYDTAYGWGDHSTAGYTDNVGDITGVTAGTGLTGGGTSGTPTLNVIGGDGITANANDIAVDSTVLRTTGAQTKTGALTIDVDNVAAGALRIEANQTNPEQDFYFAQEIYSTLSGTTATTSDREQGGIYMDLNSTATGGDTSHEHRVYGAYLDVDSTGDADLVYGIYADATATPSTGQTSLVYGGFFRGEDNGGAGQVSSVHGVFGIASSDNATSDTNSMYGGYFKSSNATDSAEIGTSHGVYSEVEVNGTTDLLGTTYVYRAEYDNNTDVAQTNTTYLYYGNYAGTSPTNAYGVYISDAVENYFGGDVRTQGDFKIGATTVIDSSRNLTNIGTISSGVITATGGAFSGHLTQSSGSITAFGNVEAGLGHVKSSQGYLIGTTTVIDSSKNLTNIGTISSGNIAATKLTIASSSNGFGRIEATDANHMIILRGNRDSTAAGVDMTTYYQYGGTVAQGKGHLFYTGGLLANQTLKLGIHNDAINFHQPLYMGGTQVIDSSRNLTNIGTISSGIITATGGTSTNWNTAYGWGDHSTAGYASGSFLPLTGGTLTGGLTGTTATFSGNAQVGGALKITEAGTAQNLLMGNQDSGGTNKPAMIMGVNGYLRFGHGSSWSGEGGTFTEKLRVDNDTDVISGNFQIGSTTVIDSSRNLTNIGTISSGVITATGGAFSGHLTQSSGSITAFGNVEAGLGHVKSSQGYLIGTTTVIDSTARVKLGTTSQTILGFDPGGTAGSMWIAMGAADKSFAVSDGNVSRFAISGTSGGVTGSGTIESKRQHKFDPVLASTSDATATMISKGSVTTTTGYQPQNWHMAFQDGGGTVRGKITSSHYSTQYSTSSDYRLKEDIQPIANATARLLAIEAVNFRWIDGQQRSDGFIAHELQEHLPEAVTGTKDATEEVTETIVAEDGTESEVTRTIDALQGVDQSKLVPLLVKTIQELEARITALENA